METLCIKKNELWSVFILPKDFHQYSTFLLYMTLLLHNILLTSSRELPHLMNVYTVEMVSTFTNIILNDSIEYKMFVEKMKCVHLIQHKKKSFTICLK